LKDKEKGDAHVTLDDASAFPSHTNGLTLSRFVSSPEDVYFQNDEVDVYSKNAEGDSQYHVAFLSSMCDDCYECADQNDCDYSFLRFETCDSLDDTDIEYGTFDFSVMQNMKDVFIDVSGRNYFQSADSDEPTALVAQVSYDNGDDYSNWIIDSGSTHHMNSCANDFLNMTLEGYDDGLLVKGLVSGTKAYGNGSCIVVVTYSVGMFNQICLEDVLYVPNLLHHHPRIFSVVSACSQDECQCRFQSNSYVLNIKLAKIYLNLSKGLLCIPTVNPSIVPNFVIMIFRIRDADSSTMFLVHNGFDNTISIPSRYVYDNENYVEYGLRVVKSLLGLRLERQNQLYIRNSSTILLDYANPIRHHTFQYEFWLEERDRMMCVDAHAYDQLCKQFCKALGLTYKLTNYKPGF
jgi:hypothetical protein